MALMGRFRRFAARHYGALQVVVVVVGIETYELMRHLMVPNWEVAEKHAHEVVSWEKFAHIEWEEWLQQTFLRVPDLVRAMNVFYFVGHFVLTGVFFFWLYHRSRSGFRRFRNGFLTATFIALFIHWTFPTAPPRLAGIGLEDTLRQLSNIDIGSPTSSSFSVRGGRAVVARRLGGRCGRRSYPLRATALFLEGHRCPLPDRSRAVTIVVTGNHFVFDALAGIAVMALGFWLSETLFERRGATLNAASRGGAVR